ncbi:MAG: heparinase II/III family protein [Proteobacteria bacterium]|nr:heparinase II/III family protein [Pseudomonadota bacterium]
MKDPGLPSDTFLCDTITRRALLFEGYGHAASIGQIRVTLLCPMRDFSSFNQLSLTATNLTETVLYAEMRLFHGSGKTDVIDEPVSLSGGRECLPPGKTVELAFPRESFGTYGKPDDWKDITRIEITCKHEKTDVSTGLIAVGIGALYGEDRLFPAGPRLTNGGLKAMLSHCASARALSLPQERGPGEDADNPYGQAYASLLSIPPYHPYPQEGADEILKGHIMGQQLPWPLQWDKNPSCILEWSHFLHRHHFLREVMKAFLEKKDRHYSAFLDQIIHDWIIAHPVPVGSNGGAGPSWETLSAAWRLREWLWIKGIAWPHESFRRETKELMLRSFWEHARHLMDHKGHPNNWIIVESTALALAGICLPELTEAAKWFEEGVSRLESEFHRQFMADGVHFELSPLYHAICLHALLEVKRAASVKHVPLPAVFEAPLERAAGYLASLCRPDFTWPSLNDSGNITGDYRVLMRLAGELFNRPDFIWIGTKGRRGTSPAAAVHIYPDAGIGVMRSGYNKDSHFLVFRAGPPGMTHIHEDVLSLDVTVHGTLCLADPGITTYAPTPLTGYYRSAVAHNMILIDGKGPERSQLAFQERVRSAREGFGFHHETLGINDLPLKLLSRKKGLECSIDTLTGICNDYLDERGTRIAVTRTVSFPAHKYWIIQDSVRASFSEHCERERMAGVPACCGSRLLAEGATRAPLIAGHGNHTVTVCWQFSPGQTNIDSCTYIIRKATSEGRGVALIPVLRNYKPDVVRSEGNTDPLCGWVSVNGGDILASHFTFSFVYPLPLTLTWVLYPLPDIHSHIPPHFLTSIHSKICGRNYP